MKAEGYLKGMEVTVSGTSGTITSVFSAVYVISCTDSAFTVTHIIGDNAGVDKEKVARYVASKMPLTTVAASGSDWETETTVTSPSSLDIADTFFKSVYMGVSKIYHQVTHLTLNVYQAIDQKLGFRLEVFWCQVPMVGSI